MNSHAASFFFEPAGMPMGRGLLQPAKFARGPAPASARSATVFCTVLSACLGGAATIQVIDWVRMFGAARHLRSASPDRRSRRAGRPAPYFIKRLAYHSTRPALACGGGQGSASGSPGGALNTPPPHAHQVGNPVPVMQACRR